MRRIRNFILLLRYWSVLKKSSKIIKDPEGAWSSAIAENLTLEEIEAVFDLERVFRILTGNPKTNRKDLKELKKSLNN